MDSQFPTSVAETTRASVASASSVVAILSGVLTVGAALLAVGHAGVRIPGISALGPGGSEAVVPAAVAFTVATLLAATVTIGAVRRRAWAWALGLVVHAVVFLGAAFPYRGIGSLVGMLVSAAAIAVLVSQPGRAAFLPREP